MRSCFFNIILALTGCQTLWPKPEPAPVPISQLWNGKIYFGNSKFFGVSQTLRSPVISCADQEFDKMVCMSVEDYTTLMQYFVQAACVNQ